MNHRTVAIRMSWKLVGHVSRPGRKALVRGTPGTELAAEKVCGLAADGVSASVNRGRRGFRSPGTRRFAPHAVASMTPMASCSRPPRDGGRRITLAEAERPAADFRAAANVLPAGGRLDAVVEPVDKAP